MPANLPPQYVEAEKRYRTARDAEEKLDALQQMLAIMPHHKGTDKLHADLRKKLLSSLRRRKKEMLQQEELAFLLKRKALLR